MTTLPEAVDALVEAVNSVTGLRGYRGDRVGAIQLPAVAVGIPTPRWSSYCDDPNEASFPVTLLVRMDDRTIESLLKFLPDVQAAIENLGATVATAIPVSYDLGEHAAAGYELTVEYPL